jgi:hypothetical protein
VGLFKNIKNIIWWFKRNKKPGRIGEINKDRWTVFCSIYNRWISYTQCLETSGERTFYDEMDKPNLNHLDHDYNEIHKATKNSGHKFPQDLKKVVITCEFCEACCLGKPNGPLMIPQIESIDRKKLLFDLYDRSQRPSVVLGPAELKILKKKELELGSWAKKFLDEHPELKSK